MTQGEHIVRKEMGYTREEYMLRLPMAVGGADMQIAGNEIEVRDGARSLRIELGEETERRLGNFRLPILLVNFVFSGYSEAEIEATLDQFWRTYQKGGG